MFAVCSLLLVLVSVFVVGISCCSSMLAVVVGHGCCLWLLVVVVCYRCWRWLWVCVVGIGAMLHVVCCLLLVVNRWLCVVCWFCRGLFVVL